MSEHISNAVFYLPFGYYYAVRLGTLPQLLSWMLIYIMPTAFYSFTTYQGELLPFAVNYLLLLTAVFSLYELGYILNDTIAIRYEQHPAIRLYPDNFRHFSRYARMIVLARFAYAAIALGVLYLLDASLVSLPLVINILAIPIIFAIYNGWRSRYNVWLYPVLVFSRYLPFMLLYRIDGLAILMLFLSFPLLNMLERFSMPAYRFPLMRRLIPAEESKTAFRVWYYALLLLILSILGALHIIPYLLILPVLILFVYRLLLALWVSRHRPTNYLNG